jgi:hypothetical protein
MQTEASRSLVKQAWTAFASRDPQRFAALFTSDAEWLAPENNGTAVALNVTHHMIGADVIAGFIACEMRRLYCDVSIIGMSASLFAGFTPTPRSSSSRNECRRSGHPLRSDQSERKS